MAITSSENYCYHDARNSPAHAYLLPRVESILAQELRIRACEKRLFDLGCGNGSVGAHFYSKGFNVTGVDPSKEGIRFANEKFPDIIFQEGSAYEDLQSRFGQFPFVISLEVVEHVYSPREYAATLFSMVQPGGTAIVSTPYHGYFKNLALSISGNMDQHFTVLWDHGHIKFWSIRTLSILLNEAGFQQIRFERVGRIACLAKSMIAIAKKPL